MMWGFMRLAVLQFATKLQKCIRMGITIFKIFIWGGISSDICSEITFYGSIWASPNENFEYSYTLILFITYEASNHVLCVKIL